MVELPNVSPRSGPGYGQARVQSDHVRAMIQGLESGWYLARDLLPRYNAWAENNGHPTTTAKSLGEELTRMGLMKGRVHGNVSSYFLTDEMVRPS